MSRRRSLPSWHVLLAGACGLGTLLVGIELGWGFGLSLFLGALVSAFVFAGVRGRRPAAAPGTRAARLPQLPPLKPGHQVVAVRDLGGGGLTELVPRGTRGVVTGTGWGTIEASFTIYGAMGTRQVLVSGQRPDFQRLG